MAAFSQSISTSETRKLRGRPLADYGDFVKKIGEGTFGVINQYTVSTTDKSYAVKETKTQENDGESFHSILNEIVFPMSLIHPNIIAYYDVYLSSVTEAKMVMPLAAMDLSRLIRTHYFDDRPDRVRLAAAQLISAVAYLTRHNILHCDIKPQNVLCFETEDDSTTYNYKLSDFGLAQSNTCLRDNDMYPIYTIWYRAPEILAMESPYTEKADVWALGCTLYELLGH